MRPARILTLAIAAATLTSPALLWTTEATPPAAAAMPAESATLAPPQRAIAPCARRAVAGASHTAHPATRQQPPVPAAAACCLSVTLPSPPPGRVIAVLLDGDAGYAENAGSFTIDDATVSIEHDGTVHGGWLLTAGGTVGRFAAPHAGTARGWWLSQRASAGALPAQLTTHLQRMNGEGTALLQVGLTDRDGKPRWVTLTRTSCAPGKPPTFATGALAQLPHRVVLEGPDKYWAAIRI